MRDVVGSLRSWYDSGQPFALATVVTPNLDETQLLVGTRDQRDAARALLAIHDAQVTGAWRRMKVCRNPECEVAFWDSSRNTSGVWHDGRTCGNVANLRESRARRSATGR